MKRSEMEKYYVTIGYHFGVIAGSVPRTTHTLDTLEQVNNFISAIEGDQKNTIDFLMVVKGVKLKRDVQHREITRTIVDKEAVYGDFTEEPEDE